MIVALVTGLVACGTWTDTSPEPSTTVQRHICASLEQALCERAIAQVIRTAPDLATAAIAVAAPRFDPPPARFGGATQILVAFIEAPGADTLPPAWVATTRLREEWTIEQWQEGPLPAHFVQAIDAARGTS